MRLTVRVVPGARRTEVGGRYGSADPPVMRVKVTARAHDGTANRAVVAAIAQTLGVPTRAVRIIAGATGRTKTVAVDATVDPTVLEQLLETPTIP